MVGIFVGILWFIFVFAVASMAKKKGRSYGSYFALSFFFSPLIGLIVLAIQGENKEELAKQNIEAGITKKCPFCANEIKKGAVVCQFCGRDLPKEEHIEILKDDLIFNDKWKCGKCDTINDLYMVSCKKCGKPISKLDNQ